VRWFVARAIATFLTIAGVAFGLTLTFTEVVHCAPGARLPSAKVNTVFPVPASLSPGGKVSVTVTFSAGACPRFSRWIVYVKEPRGVVKEVEAVFVRKSSGRAVSPKTVGVLTSTSAKSEIVEWFIA
jgi:hypothetical protein